VKDNDTLEGTPPVQISDLIKKADGILDSAGGAVNNLTASTGNISSITSKINNGAGTMGALVNDKQVYQNLQQTTTEMQEDMEAVKHNFLLSHFFHKRGYEDASQLTKNAIPQLPAVTPAKRFSWDAQEIFDKPDAAKLKEKQNKTLDAAGSFLQANPYGLAVVAGYADMKGDTAEQKILTEARAMVVRDYLVQKFKMDDSRVKTIGLGKSPDAPAAGVEVLVYPQGTNAPASPNGKPEPREPAKP
jgi:outer membrane protein OmpA-like peptidoglycan-associated protein